MKNQKGFTLIEMIIALAITGLILGAASTTVYQLIAGNSKNQNEMLATRQVQQVGHYVSQDVLMANIVDNLRTDDPQTNIPGSTDVLTVYWEEFYWDPDLGGFTSDKHKVTYNLTEEGIFYRYNMETPIGNRDDSDIPPIDDAGWGEPKVQEIARFVVLDDLNISPGFNDDYQMTVTAFVPGWRSGEATRTFDMKTRPEG
jgi:prepilin-type N-terminal cleavage/methylation domain-containing protein